MGTCRSQTPPSLQTGCQELLSQDRTKNSQQSPDVLHIEKSRIQSEAQGAYAFLRKTCNIPTKQIQSACYIPERNLLLTLSNDFKTISIYHTRNNFNLLAVRTSDFPITTISYSKELNKILVGGCDVQIWNPKNLKIEARSLEISFEPEIHSLTYVSGADVIVAKTKEFGIFVYDKNLALLASFRIQSDRHPWSLVDHVFCISKELLLVVFYIKEQQRLVLLNLKRATSKKYKQIFIPMSSCVEVTQQTPNKVFTCLTGSAQDFNNLSAFVLTQFMIDPETEELVVLKSADVSFRRLSRIENSNYFLAEEFGLQGQSKIFLVSLNRGQIEVIRVVSKPAKLLEKLQNSTLIMLKNEPLMICINMNEMDFYSIGCRKFDKSEKISIALNKH